MNSLEDDLRSTLRRREPPDGFAGRVLDRLSVEHGGRRTYRFGWERSWLRWAAAVLVLILLTASLAEYHRRREAEAARSQAVLALRIASTQLNNALKKAVELPPVAP